MSEPREPEQFEEETAKPALDEGATPATPRRAVPEDAGGVSDRYVARRVAEHQAAQAEQAARTGETAAAGSMLFYVLLGILIATLLTVVIFATDQPGPGAAPSPRGAVTGR